MQMCLTTWKSFYMSRVRNIFFQTFKHKNFKRCLIQFKVLRLLKAEMRFVKIKMRYTATLFTPLLRYKGSSKISVVTEYNPNFPIQLVATGTILKLIIMMKKKKKRSCYCRKELEVQVAHRVKQEPILIQQSQV